MQRRNYAGIERIEAVSARFRRFRETQTASTTTVGCEKDQSGENDDYTSEGYIPTGIDELRIRHGGGGRFDSVDRVDSSPDRQWELHGYASDSDASILSTGTFASGYNSGEIEDSEYGISVGRQRSRRTSLDCDRESIAEAEKEFEDVVRQITRVS
ncbi:Hypothetical protein CINCED_3A023240 [Cinara cedri]|uniref:Uncharacterized protein n=1 Tax=Cinara cedri TaxID=506608 RepID=A0A5E4MWC5_9HEMI|nr:Hypothetical protein CINCED_3A023240 [Cinara cedri]